MRNSKKVEVFQAAPIVLLLIVYVHYRAMVLLPHMATRTKEVSYALQEKDGC